MDNHALDLCSWLQQTIGQHLGVAAKAVDPRLRFRELGLDSLRMAKIVAQLSAHLGRSLPPTVPWEHPTVEALARHLASSSAVAAPAPPQADSAEPPADRAASSFEPIAIVGMGCRLPGGVRSPDELWALLRAGRHGIREVPVERWDIDHFFDEDTSQPGKVSTRWGGFVDEVDRFDAEFFGISPREARQMDPQQRLALELAWEALEDAGIDPLSQRERLVGVFVGAMWSDYARLTHGDPRLIDSYTRDRSGHVDHLGANQLFARAPGHEPDGEHRVLVVGRRHPPGVRQLASRRDGDGARRRRALDGVARQHGGDDQVRRDESGRTMPRLRRRRQRLRARRGRRHRGAQAAERAPSPTATASTA